MNKSLIIFIGFYFFTGCSGSGGNSPPPVPTLSISSNVSSLLLSTSAILTWSSSHATNCLASNSWTGTKNASGTESVTPTLFGNNTYILTCSGDGGSISKEIIISTKSDPLYHHQWHLNNSGQTNFATNSGLVGKDLNLDSVIASGINGSGVIVAVVDSGLEIGHEDLAANIVLNKSYDYLNADNNPEPRGTSGDHGTSIAGLIAAVAGNDIGIRGVAPSAKLVGYNYLTSGAQSISNYVDAMGGASGGAESTDVDIFNMSFGYGVSQSFPILANSTEEAAHKNGTENLRNNKGAIYVASSGNDWSFKSGSSTYYCGPNYSTSNQAEMMSCGDTFFDGINSSPYLIVVSALNARGVKSSYSSPGSAVWVSGFGGETGWNNAYLFSTLGFNTNNPNPAIMTVDQSSCSKGYVRSGVNISSGNNDNPFQSSNHSQNESCNYTSTFNGTSSAAPTVAGVIALMLDANENLSWRDVKHILANTSVQVDSSRSKNLNSVNQYSWITNAAGYKHHSWYGFGMIDAAAAVTAAINYNTNLGSFINTGVVTGSNGVWTDECIVNCFISVAITAPNNSNGKIESVKVLIKMTKTDPEHVSLELVSPDGTRAPILPAYTAVRNNPNATEFSIGINAFYGENMTGTWKLHINDHVNDGIGGIMNSFKIIIYGN